MKRNLVLLICVTVMLSVVPVIAQAQGEGCATDKCHSSMGKAEWVHGPVGALMCTVCHTRVEGKDHQFTLAAEDDELCIACHEDSRDMLLEEHLHTPVATGDCVGCHDPHQSEHRFTLKGQAADLCYVCHDRAEFEKAFVHGPIAVSECNACHNPHASAHPNQLVAAPERICYDCHEEQANIPDRRHQHAPVAEDCTNCHEVHASAARYLLPKEGAGLCRDCHDGIPGEGEVEFAHQPVAAGECSQCHDVHGSDQPRLYPMAAPELCFSCHSELGDYVAQQTHLHGPMEEGDCNACHNPHGSGNHMMLKKYFPPEFYAPYETENYATCFDCHNSDIALEEHTTTLTDFRDGDWNMHYLHVNKDVKGRTCRACHQVHASSQGKHVRASVPFGDIDWELPVTFTKADNGGSCVVGCHGPKEYTR